MAREGKPPAYQHYPADYLSDEDTATMTLEEEGAYRRLLDHHWREGSIPADPEQLRRLLKWIPMARFRKIWPALARCFRSEPGGARLINDRLAAQRRGLEEFREAQSERGRKGAETRWSGDGGRNATAKPQALLADDSASALCDLHTAREDTKNPPTPLARGDRPGQGAPSPGPPPQAAGGEPSGPPASQPPPLTLAPPASEKRKGGGRKRKPSDPEAPGPTSSGMPYTLTQLQAWLEDEAGDRVALGKLDGGVAARMTALVKQHPTEQEARAVGAWLRVSDFPKEPVGWGWLSARNNFADAAAKGKPRPPPKPRDPEDDGLGREERERRRRLMEHRRIHGPSPEEIEARKLLEADGIFIPEPKL